MRMDSIQAALSHNEPCGVQRFLDSRDAVETGGANAAPPGLRFGPAAGPEGIAPSAAGERRWAGERLAAECERQIASDARGVVGLPGLLWQGDLPGLSPRGAMFVRDMGPERNARLLGQFPGRRALVLMPASPASRLREPVLVSYDRGSSLLWPVGPGRGAGGEASP
jgi:hypothetical protein